MASPLFSIVTSSFNQGAFLEETIQSVIAQARADVEHIVIDGGSTDASVEILRRYDEHLSYWVSERDAGQPAAWNEGVRQSTGSFVAFLNSDDLLLPGGLDAIARLAGAHADAEWLIGGTNYFGNGQTRSYPGVRYESAAKVLFFATYAPQPGHFLRRSLIERVGAFEETLQFSFDFDYFIRCVLVGARSEATDERVAAFRFHDASKSVAQLAAQRADTNLVEARYWTEILRREGGRARSYRDDYKGHLALEASRDALGAGHRGEAWRLFLEAARCYPRVIGTRAFVGTGQRLLGLRAV